MLADLLKARDQSNITKDRSSPILGKKKRSIFECYPNRLEDHISLIHVNLWSLQSM